MKNKNFVCFVMGLSIALLTIPHVTFAQEDRRYDRREEWRHGDTRDERRQLEGTWYLNGDRDKPCQIVFIRGGLEGKNERGETTRLVYNRYGSIQASDWEGGLRGEVRRQSIEWANGTTWTRVADRR
jgi:hypothetical protein